MLPEPDYEKYSFDELIDVYEHVDREKYPDRFKKVALLLGETLEENNTSLVTREVNKQPSRPKKLEDTPEVAEMKKMQRIEEFFDSLSESGSEYHSGSYCGGGDSGGDGGGGD